MKQIISLFLTITLLSGCATVPDGRGGTKTELTDTGKVAVTVVVAAVLIGALAALGGSNSGPDRSYVTTYPDGSRSRTDVYSK